MSDTKTANDAASNSADETVKPATGDGAGKPVDPTSGPDAEAVAAAQNEGMDAAIGQPTGLADNPLLPRIDELEAERDALKDQILRALAETENVRKRANREIADARVYAVEKFARDLLNVSDNLARALDAIPAHERPLLTDTARTLISGVELTQKELTAVLARHGVTAVDASPGAAFDPANHQAVTQIPSEHPAGSVAQMFQSGWKIGDRTLRAAMVAVSAGGGKPN